MLMLPHVPRQYVALRRTVDWVKDGDLGVIVDALSEVRACPQVDQFQWTFSVQVGRRSAEDHVGGLDISVDDPDAVQLAKALKHLLDNGLGDGNLELHRAPPKLIRSVNSKDHLGSFARWKVPLLESLRQSDTPLFLPHQPMPALKADTAALLADPQHSHVAGHHAWYLSLDSQVHVGLSFRKLSRIFYESLGTFQNDVLFDTSQRVVHLALIDLAKGTLA
mmetsp:Transcript_8218/g.30314  ORF Transcript_8218/g.30314 Transcript_8218/m.30314 type:complete len:221 (+) Transcript_8218:1125-1787(+)